MSRQATAQEMKSAEIVCAYLDAFTDKVIAFIDSQLVCETCFGWKTIAVGGGEEAYEDTCPDCRGKGTIL